jgi:glycosyltransferase involved in cell wall biosynthesis
MRILLLTQFFDPEPTLKGMAFAKALVARGHTVEVLTGFPNYPGGTLYPGYRLRLYRREEHRGIVVHRVPLYPSHDRSAFHRLLNYMSFAITATIFGLFVVGNIEAIYVHHPPVTIGLPAIVLSKLLNVPFVLEIQDLWPDTLRATGMVKNERILALTGWWASRIYRAAGHISVISPGFRQALLLRGQDSRKVSVLYNWCDESRIVPAPRDPALHAKLGFENRFNVIFAGTMGTAQALDTILDAAGLLAVERPDVQIVLVGGGVDRARLEQLATERNLPNVRFLQRQPPERMGAILALSDAVLVHLRDDPLFRITIPSKTQTYLYCGLPIVMAVSGDAAALVSEAGAGVCCPPQSPRSLADAIISLASSSPTSRKAMGRAGQIFYDRELSLSAGIEKFEAQLLAARTAA